MHRNLLRIGECVTALHLHLVSDSTGETLESLVKAGLAQFEEVDVVKHFWPMVRSEGHLDRVVDEIGKRPGLVMYTLVSGHVRERLEARCAGLGLPVISVLDPVIEGLQRMVGRQAKPNTGGQHALDESYFKRIEAITYTMEHDDGIGAEEWDDADIVLVGVSRSSKTPTSIYLANRGYKVANMPVVPGRPVPVEFADLKKPLVVGLTVGAERLVQVRRNRILGQGAAGAASLELSYADLTKVGEEVVFARRLFADRGWPVIDVTRRSIEETAAAVINLLGLRG